MTHLTGSVLAVLMLTPLAGCMSHGDEFQTHHGARPAVTPEYFLLRPEVE